MATALATLKPTKAVSTTFENWKDLIFLVKEPTRRGTLAWRVRVKVGDLDPLRAGPYSSEREARKEFAEKVYWFEDGIYDIFPADGSFEP